MTKQVTVFRDNTGLDISTAAKMCVWDNTKRALQIHDDSIVVITPVMGLFKNREEWLNADCVIGTFTGVYEKLECETGLWPSGDCGYVHRYYLDDAEIVKVKDLGDEVLNPMKGWGNGPCLYIRADK